MAILLVATLLLSNTHITDSLAHERTIKQGKIVSMRVKYEDRSVSSLILFISNLILAYGPQINEFITRLMNSPGLAIPFSEKVRIIKENFDKLVEFLSDQGISLPSF